MIPVVVLHNPIFNILPLTVTMATSLGLSLTTISGTQVTLSWTNVPNYEDISAFRVLVSDGKISVSWEPVIKICQCQVRTQNQEILYYIYNNILFCSLKSCLCTTQKYSLFHGRKISSLKFYRRIFLINTC